MSYADEMPSVKRPTLTAKVVLLLQVVETILTGGTGPTAGIGLTVTLTTVLLATPAQVSLTQQYQRAVWLIL